MEQKIRNRLKSPIVWMSIASQILSVMVLLGVIGQEWSNAITGIVSAYLGTGYAAFKRYSSKSVRRIYVAVVKRSLYNALSFVYRYKIRTWCYIFRITIVKCDALRLQSP
jgi:hypothetical protein